MPHILMPPDRPYYNINYDNTTNTYKIFDEGHTKDYNDLSLKCKLFAELGNRKQKVLRFLFYHLLMF